MTSSTPLNQRTRSTYPFSLTYQTRWSDNDQYAHLNNAIYYHLFDSIINTYLINHCSLSPTQSSTIALVVESHCQFFSPASFPTTLHLGLRISKLGNRSVQYEVGVFTPTKSEPIAVGGYTHVFVERESRKTVSSMEEAVRQGLNKLYHHSTQAKL